MKKYWYEFLETGVDINGWYKYTLKRNDGKIVKVTRKRISQLLKEERLENY